MIRRADVGDADVLGHLLWDFDTEFETDPDAVEVLARRFAEILPNPDVVALLAGELGAERGFCLVTLRPTVWFDGPVAQLEELYVVPTHRGHGTGTAVLLEACRLVRDRGCPEMHINVDEPDTGARRFYERHGFVSTEAGEDGRMLCYVGSTGETHRFHTG